MRSEFLTGYIKKCGHIVLEKAGVKGNNVFYTVCGDLDEMTDEGNVPFINGRTRGKLASGFQREIIGGISRYGEDHLFTLSEKPASDDDGNPLTGPEMNFGSGCAGIFAVSENAYVWTQEGSGMCVIRISEVLGKSRVIKCLSSEIGGDTTVALAPGSILAVCPEEWADEQLLPEKKTDNAFLSLISVFSAGDIRDDAFFDRVLGELTDDDFKGCMAALAVKSLNI
ncbi:MAG: hypothetical protein J5696_10055 [Lachnospiraceae bacterium]|nr:hypothetical protein [Lachnospiraceae bacterium]